jgi:hypothetical protein
MIKKGNGKAIFRFMFFLAKIAGIVAGTVLIFKNRKSIHTFLQKQNLIIAGLYGLLLSLIALVFRLVLFVSSLLQQAGGPR